MKTRSLVPTAILAIIALFYLLVPHDYHISSGLDFGVDHPVHMALGVVLLVAAVLVYLKLK